MEASEVLGEEMTPFFNPPGSSAMSQLWVSEVNARMEGMRLVISEIKSDQERIHEHLSRINSTLERIEALLRQQSGEKDIGRTL